MPPIDPNLAAAATIGGAVFGAISAYNSFRQVAELKEINSKLDKVIGLQLQTLEAIKALGIQFRADLEQAFVRDLNLELKAYQQSFVTLTSVLKERQGGVHFPTGGPDYRRRLEDLMFKVQDFTNKLALYGPATYQALLVNAALLESMFKVARVDTTYRRAFHEQRMIDYKEFESHFVGVNDNLRESNKAIFEQTAGLHRSGSMHPDWGVMIWEIQGNPVDGFQERLFQGTQTNLPPFRPLSNHPEASNYLSAQNTYRQAAYQGEAIQKTVFPLFASMKTSTTKLLAAYT
jgi:hypothetical protein